ncbi:MAG: CHAT domain-containing protein, partial [Pseudomonadota bacterium]|nr:CHAT domain-containing protein [Pseudomonadota bacterium]
SGLSRKNIDRLSDEQSLVLESYFTNNIQSFERHLSDQLYMGGNVIEFGRLNQVRAYLNYLKFLLLVDDFEKFERNFLQVIDKFIELVDFHVLASSDEVFDLINPIAKQLIQLYTNKTLQSSGEKRSLNILSRLVSGVKNAEQNLDAILYRNVHLHGNSEDKADLKSLFQIDKRLAVDNVYTRETVAQNWFLPLQFKQGLKKTLLKKFAVHIRKDLKSNIIEYLQAKSPIRIPEGTVHLNYYRLDEEESKLFLLAHYPDGNIDVHKIVTQKPLSHLLDLRPFLSTQNLATFSSILLPEEVNLESTKRISISPLSMLSSFPFEALNYKNKFLVENFDVYYNPSSIFSDHSLNLTNQDSVSIFSNPVYKPFDLSEGLNVNTASRSISRSQRNEYSFSPLFETKLESEIIASLLSKKTSKILSFDNKAASEQNLLSLKSPRLLHIASHGFSIDLKKEVENKPHNIAKSKSYYVIESPLSVSGLALSFADLNKHTTDSENDGVIDYYELGAMDLSDTDLIVLSSCETANGSVQDGYIFTGLRKALALSGVAHSVTTSQKIPSDDTVEFMHMFYHKLLDHSYISALSEAKREMIKNNKSTEAWAPFLLSVN